MKIMSVVGLWIVCVTSVASQVNIEPGGTITIENESRITTNTVGVSINASSTDGTAAGSLKLIGTSGKPALLVLNGNSFVVQGIFYGTYFRIESPGTNGLQFQRNGTAGFVPRIDKFDNGEFDVPSSNINYVYFVRTVGASNDLSFNAGDTSLFSACGFFAGGSNVTNAKMDSGYLVNSSSTDQIDWKNSIGSLAGETYDSDPGEPPTPGRIKWTDSTAPGVPAITNVPRKTKDSTPKIKGTSEKGASINVYYNGSNLLGTTTALSNGTWTLDPTTTLSSGVYSMTATASDANGNTSAASSGLSLTVDLDAPNLPTNVTVTALNGGVLIEWTASTSSDAAGYNIYRKGPGDSQFYKINSKPVLGTKYKDYPLTNGSQYCYKVSAVDDALAE